MNRASRILALTLTIGCARTADTRRSPFDTVPITRRVAVGTGVSLEVVDWGGTGLPLVFLAGLGNTAHVYDDYAPQFRDSFHVLGITRRGFGASSGTPPAALDTLVADLQAVIDTLHLGRPVLVGHSIAGEELTRWAELHGSQCASLIYLDAAYDRTGLSALADAQPSVPGPRMSPADFRDIASIRAFHARVMGVREPESEIRATSRFDAQGRYRGEVTPDSLKARVASGVESARYDRLACRALAIYAVPDAIVDVVPYAAELDAAGRRQADSLLRFVAGVVATSRARVAKQPRVEIVELRGANHFIFLQQPGKVAQAMRVFLAGTTR